MDFRPPPQGERAPAGMQVSRKVKSNRLLNDHELLRCCCRDSKML